MSETIKHHKIHADKDHTIHSGGHALHDVKEAAGHFIDDAQDAAAAVKDDLEDVARRTGKHARKVADSAENSLTDIGTTMKAKIRDNPVQSSLIALGLGFVVGIFYRR